MFNTSNPVRPGDLITAEQWNALLALLIDLQGRVETLEASALRVEILDVVAPSPLRTGDTVTVLGHNFKTTVGTARAFLDGNTEVSIAPGTFTTSRLDFILPTSLNPPPTGKIVVLRVSNGKTDDTRRLTVMPRVEPVTGEVAIVWTGVDPATLKPQLPALWSYTARSRATDTATFTIEVEVNGAAVPKRLYQVLDANQEVIESRQLTLNPRDTQPTRFFLRIESFPSIANGTRFTQWVNFMLNDTIFSASDPEGFVVGLPNEQPDTSIEISLAGVIPSTALTNPNIIIPPANGAEVALDVLFARPGEYIATVSDAAGFSVDRSGVPTTPYLITQAEIDREPNKKAKRDITLGIGHAPIGIPQQNLVIRIQEPGNPQKQQMTLVLRPS